MHPTLHFDKFYSQLKFSGKLFLLLVSVFCFSELHSALYTFSGNATLNGINGPIQKCEAKWIGQAMIYPSSGFNGGAGFGSITTVGFRVVGSGSNLNIPFKIYLKSVGATTTFSGTPTWATALSGATLSFSGNCPSSLAAGTWYDVTLNTPYNWASGNLEVLVECDWGQVTGCGTTPVWAYNVASATDQQWLNNTSAAALQTTAGSAADQYRPDIRLNVSAPPTPPTVTGFNPTSACAGSGASVVITGTDFTGATNVSFNGTSATFTVNSATQITATLPAGATTGTISVTTSAGTGTSLSSFTVNPLPANPGNPTSNSPQCVSPGVTVTPSGSAPVGETWYWQTSASGTSTSNSSDTYSVTSAGTSTVYLRSQNNSTGCWSAGSGSVSITVIVIPATPGTITGSNSVCSGSTNSYSIATVSGATSYTWTLPNGWTGNSSTSSISAMANASGGAISVTANNSCGSSSAQTLNVSIATAPATPGAISGSTSICSGSTNSYSIATVSGATSYTWTSPNGWTGSSTTNSISATANSSGGTISVTANNTCGISTAQTLAVSIVSAPATPGTITGSNNVCSGSTNSYSIATVNGATSYTWTLPNGWSGTSSIENISAMAGSTGGNVSVTANNSCGSSSAQTVSVTVVTAPVTPGTISGANSICSGSTNNYSVATVSGATSYTWTLPNGWSGTSSSESISATANTTAGNISVTANNNCGSSTTQELNVSIETVPAAPGIVVGLNFVCTGSTNSYSVATISGATSYTWTLPNGWTGTSSTETISATAGSIGGNVSVTANNACGSSSAQALSVTIMTVPATPGTITGANSICSGTANDYSVAAVSGATSYTWTLPSGWSGVSSSESITANSGANGGSISVTAENSCGVSAAQTMSVTVNALPLVAFDFTQNPVCKNTPTITLTGTPTGGTFIGQGVTGNSFSPTALAVGNYVITYTYTDGNTCSASDTSTVIVTVCSGVDDIEANNIEVYPNPFGSELVLSANRALENGIAVLRDVTGKEIGNYPVRNGNSPLRINTASLPKGVYLLQVTSGAKTIAVKKVIRLE